MSIQEDDLTWGPRLVVWFVDLAIIRGKHLTTMAGMVRIVIIERRGTVSILECVVASPTVWVPVYYSADWNMNVAGARHLIKQPYNLLPLFHQRTGADVNDLTLSVSLVILDPLPAF